jgi:hypothetical protein
MDRTGLAALAAALLSLAALPASARAQDVVVRGRVYDPTSNGPGIQNAQITLGGRGTLSDRDGTFVFRGVPRGEYQLRVRAFGYEELQARLTLVRDTTLMLPVRADPIELDSVGIVLEKIDFDGRVRDPRRADSWVSGAEVTSDQGHDERSNLFGRFDLDDVFDGPPLRVSIRAFRYLPLDTTFIPDDEDRRSFDLVPDPVMDRIIAAYVTDLDERAERHIYNKYKMPLNRFWTSTSIDS